MSADEPRPPDPGELVAARTASAPPPSGWDGIPTPSQTVGPFFSIGMADRAPELTDPSSDAAVEITGTVTDAEGPVGDATLEIWQADGEGRYPGWPDADEHEDAGAAFAGFARCATDADGHYRFVTLKPGRVPGPQGGEQAPHLAVSVFARGLLRRLVTRIYFPDEPDANAADPILNAVPDSRRATLVARPEDGDGGALRFDVRLQGDGETVFFDV